MKPVRWSNLKYMAQSPAHYKYALDHPKEPTPAMRMGDRVDSLVWGDARVDEFSVYEGERRGTAWKEFKAAHAETTILTADEDATAKGIAAALMLNDDARELLSLEHGQQRIRWTVAGRDCIGTPDAFEDDRQADLKVAFSVNPKTFMWHALRQGWIGQSVWYSDGRGIARPRLYIVAVEPKPPYVVQVYQLTENAIQLGRQQWSLYFNTLRVCEDSDSWPGYCQSVMELDAPDEFSIVVDGEEIAL